MNDVLIADPDCLQQKIRRVCDAGIAQLCVVVDWDRTLTKAHNEAGEDTTSYLAIVQGGYLGEGYRKDMVKLYNQYRPMEVSHVIGREERAVAMYAWWAEAFALLQKYKLTEAMIEDVARQDLMQLRAGAEVFFRQLADLRIPVLILSAGIGNIIAQFLMARALMFENIQVQANRLKFDQAHVVTGFVEPVVHSLNKAVAPDFVQNRPFVLLAGDTLEDAQMVLDQDCDTIVRVGFLNTDVEQIRDRYLDAYDVVVCNDGGFEAVNDLLMQMVGG